MGNGSNYATAYFDIGSVRVFGVPGTNIVVSGSNTTSSSNSTSTNGTSGSKSSAWSVSVDGRWISMLGMALGLVGVGTLV